MAITGAGQIRGGTRVRRLAQKLAVESVAGINALQKQATVASASEIDISVDGDTIIVTGTVTINSIADMPAPYQHGVKKLLRFNNALQLTYSSALLVPGGANYTTADGDTAWANWDDD